MTNVIYLKAEGKFLNLTYKFLFQHCIDLDKSKNNIAKVPMVENFHLLYRDRPGLVDFSCILQNQLDAEIETSNVHM